MRNIVRNNGTDLILELLRQSKVIGTKTEKKDENILRTDLTELNHTPRTSVRSSDPDGKLVLSMKDNDISQKRKDEYFQTIKNYIEAILNRMTEQDYIMLFNEGFKAEDLTIESLVSAIQTIKEYGIIKDYHENSDKEGKGEISDDELAAKMKDFNLPVTKESMERIKGALKLSEDIPYIEKKDLLYLYKNDLQPTIENLYKARYSRQNHYISKKLSDADWEELLPQVKEIIDKTGLSADADMLNDARWLIENNLPLTKGNLEILAGFDGLAQNYDKETVLNKILMGMREGKYPEEAVVLGNEDALSREVTDNRENTTDPHWQKVRRLTENIHKDYDREIIKAVKSGKELTLKDLEDLNVNDTEAEEVPEDELTEDQMAKVIAAKRQLEEIRLKMTAEAALRLEKKGFSIDTRPLQEVVEKLRQEEENHYRQLYNMAGITPDEEEIKVLSMTTQSMQELRSMPAYILGATLYDKARQTVSGLLDAGRNMLAELEKAKEAYEPLLTQPRSDFGDSIGKAFANMDSLMKEMGIEDTVYNRRAIRILAYNRMEITREAIEQVKVYDLKVNYLLQNLNPGIAVQIIKEGINPMDIPVDELNALIEKLNGEGYSSLEKYSTYLYRLEKDAKISEAEKKAYIGIYRLLYQIEKSDGAALGAVVNSGREVTLNNLLTALRTLRKGTVDYKLDEDFGLLKDMSLEKETITDQLGAVFGDTTAVENPDRSNTAYGEIQKALIKQLLESLTPGRLYQLHHKIKEDTPHFSEGQAWDAIGNMSVEKLLDEIRDMNADAGEDHGYYYEKLKEFREIYSNCDQAIRFLNDFKLPCTTTNLIMAEYILSNKGTLFKNLKKQLKKTDNLTDTLIDRKTMNEAYDGLEKEVNEIIDEESKKGNIDSFKLNQLKSMGLQMQFIKTLAKREFYHIPVEVSGKITHINLTIIRGKGDKGKVTVSFMSDRFGSIKAEAAIKGNKLSGFFVCDNAGGLKLLQGQTEKLESLLKDENLEVKQLNFCLQQSPEAIRGYIGSGDMPDTGNPETERILYRVAKAILHMITSAEADDMFSHKEVAEIK